MAEALLALDRVNAFYGDSHVLHDVSLQLSPGRLLALLGRNGAGKSTCMHAVVGFLPPRSGAIRIGEREMQGAAPEAICRQGVGFVPQGRRIFPTLTVYENLHVAIQKPRIDGAPKWNLDGVFERFPVLAARRKQVAGSLPGGEQQMLAIARALVGNPSVVLMDEPSEGLAPVIVEELARAVKRLAATEGLTMVVVEQNTRLALDLSPRTAVMDRGRIVFDGPSEALKRDPDRLHRLIGVGKG